MNSELIEKIRAWLKETGKTRQELAQLLGVSKRTVDNWFSGRPINPSHAKAIRILLSPAPEKDAQGTVLLRFTEGQMEIIERRFPSREAFEMALKSFITGLLYERSVEICRTHGLEFDEDGEVVDGE